MKKSTARLAAIVAAAAAALPGAVPAATSPPGCPFPSFAVIAD